MPRCFTSAAQLDAHPRITRTIPINHVAPPSSMSKYHFYKVNTARYSLTRLYFHYENIC